MGQTKAQKDGGDGYKNEVSSYAGVSLVSLSHVFSTLHQRDLWSLHFNTQTFKKEKQGDLSFYQRLLKSRRVPAAIADKAMTANTIQGASN